MTERARKGVSYAFQQPVRFKGLTVRQLIETAAGGAIDECGLCDILSKVGLCAHEYCNREVDATLSGGEMKRIEIATVLARHTKLTVFDEPEAGIDLWSFSSLIQTFQDIRRELKGTMIIISHQERILRAADEVLLLDGGRVSESGTAEHMLGGVLKADSAYRACHKQEAVFHERNDQEAAPSDHRRQGRFRRRVQHPVERQVRRYAQQRKHPHRKENRQAGTGHPHPSGHRRAKRSPSPPA